MSIQVGNILGAARAELDTQMLDKAFVETTDYQALLTTQDFNFVVGRRGTGKSAICKKLQQYLITNKNILLITETPKEHFILEYQNLLNKVANDYRLARAISRLVWENHILLEIIKNIKIHYKGNKIIDEFIRSYYEKYKNIIDCDYAARCTIILRETIKNGGSGHELPSKIASTFQTEKLKVSVKKALSDISSRVVALYDGLDEGWIPNIIATAILGGLAAAASDFSNIQSSIHITLFIRDNMFRSLANFDSDFSKHIEGNTIRLHWDGNSLLNLIAKRLRIILKMEDVESDIKVWNRFAAKELSSRDGFQACLKNTLYRPRDILVLLNSAYQVAVREGRENIVGKDIDVSARTISQDRLNDLLKEYDTVLPGLKDFIFPFYGRPASDKYSSVISILDDACSNTDYSKPESVGFALFNSGKEIFSALYGIGFIGVMDNSTGGYIFCHDGSAAGTRAIPHEQLTIIHPCYWKALEVTDELSGNEIIVQINDEYEVQDKNALGDIRLKRLGSIIGELPKIPLGHDGSEEFPLWVLKSIRILFAGKLSNIQPNPNKGGIRQRDIVACNLGNSSFWNRIFTDFQSRQITFEVKNYEVLKSEDFDQILSYSTAESGEYGRFIIVVSRNPNEYPSSVEISNIKHLWFQHQRRVMILPAPVIARCLSKMRSQRKFDYTEDYLSKTMDTYARSYLDLKQEPNFRKNKKK